jgi:ACS family tartrate transporter-like MFS transporter
MTVQPTLSPQDIERSVIKKVLTRLVPFLSFLYVFNLMDRGNISLAALTMKTDLHLSDRAYGLGVGIFFIGYFIFEVPSNLIMERVGARRWIARIMLTWGLISASMMFIRTPVSMCVLRFLLGVAEAGFYPGILLYLTYWVPGTARTRVLSSFLALNAVLGLIGGPIGSLLLKMNGVGGLAGWQWLFLMEGTPSVLLAFAVWKILPDSPMRAAWLSAEEKAWIADSLAREERTSQNVKHLSFRVALSEPRILHLCLIFFLTAVAGNAVGSFSPEMIQVRSGGQWSASFVAFVGIVPAIVGALAMFLSAFHSDRTGARRTHVLWGYTIAGLGYLACAFVSGPHVTPAILTLAALSLNTLGERVAAGSYWTLTTNLMGTRAAAGGIAFINSVGNLGGFFGPSLMAEFKTRTGGGYSAGLCMAAGLFFAAAVGAYRLRRDAPTHRSPEEQFAEETAAVSQPEQHIP